MPWRRRLLVLVAFLTGFVLDGRAQSLADVARQEAERRKTVKTPAKVYTNRDLRPVPAAGRQSPSDVSRTLPDGSGGQSPADGGAKPDVGTAASQSGQPGHTEDPREQDPARWRERLDDLQTTLERNLLYVDALQSRINALTNDFSGRDDPAQRMAIASDRQKAIAELERLKAQLVRDRAAIEAFREDARRAGVSPGWLR
jgi:hypothetical protein